MLETVLLIVLVVIALALIGLVLIQQGKGADAGASFGGGASQTVFGSAGTGNFLTKSSWILAGLFFVICLGLAYIAREKASGGDFSFAEPEPVVEEVVETDVPQYQEEEAATDVPVAPAEAADAVTEDVPAEPVAEPEAVEEAPVEPAQ
ncbi:MAG: preprotein translocase subunit SecG [Ketobacter sp.]|nr:MAG: preprotein translocase subunit SecG [Ketobacter sp.]